MKEKWILYKVKKKQKEAMNKGYYSLFNSKFAKVIFMQFLKIIALELRLQK